MTQTPNTVAASAPYRNLTPWKHPNDYGGQTWYGWYAVAGQSRDSDALERSNYKTILAELKQLNSELRESDIDPRNAAPWPRNGRMDYDAAGDSTVTDTRCNHWAVGWVETVYVHSSNVAACERAEEILSALEDYPVFDESDFSETESEDEAQSWDSWARHEFERSVSRRFETWCMDRMVDAIGDDEADKRVSAIVERFEDLNGNTLYELFRDAADAANVYWVHESDGATIDVDRVAGAVDMADLFGRVLGECEAIFSVNAFCAFDARQQLLSFVV